MTLTTRSAWRASLRQHVSAVLLDHLRRVWPPGAVPKPPRRWGRRTSWWAWGQHWTPWTQSTCSQWPSFLLLQHLLLWRRCPSIRTRSRLGLCPATRHLKKNTKLIKNESGAHLPYLSRAITLRAMATRFACFSRVKGWSGSSASSSSLASSLAFLAFALCSFLVFLFLFFFLEDCAWASASGTSWGTSATSASEEGSG